MRIRLITRRPLWRVSAAAPRFEARGTGLRYLRAVRALAELPFVPGAERFFGHTRVMQRDRLGFVEAITTHVDRVARMGAIGVDAIVVNHPEVLQELLVEKARVFDKSLITRFSLAPIAGEGLFTSRYDLWKGQRKLMAPLFQPAQLATYADAMVECAERGLAEWRDGEELRILRETTRITMSVAGKTLFDTDTFGEADAIGHALTVALDWAGDNAPSAIAIAHLMTRRLLVSAGEALAEREGRWFHTKRADALVALGHRFEKPIFVPGPEGKKLREAVALLDERVTRMIEDRRAANRDGAPHPDLLSRLLAARDGDDGATMSDTQVRDEVLTLFIAGHETTATALAWCVYCLARHPEIYAAVEREVDALPGPPRYEDLPRLALTQRVFKEVLRLYPPVYIVGRQAVEASSLDDVALPDDVVVLMSAYALHRRPDLWPAPNKFDPDRFLPAEEAKRHRLAWLPFGAGPRICIGNHFALMEAQLILACMLRHARFEVTHDEVPNPSATLRPEHGVRARVRLRRARA